MANPHADLQALAVRRTPISGPEIRPPRRLISRVVLPGVLLLGFGALVTWASWDLIAPATPVKVTPVVARKGMVEATGVQLFRATGWIEPSPFPDEVPVLVEGTVAELLVLPGYRVAKGDVVAVLVQLKDAELAVQTAARGVDRQNALIEAGHADIAEAEAQLNNAKLAARIEDELLKKGAVTSPTKLEQAQAAQAIAEARLRSAHARLKIVETDRDAELIKLDEARLRRDRMKITAPVAGVVLQMNVRPGSMVGARSGNAQPEPMMTLYQPERLQVRVEVPSGEFHHIRSGQPAIVEVDTVLPGRRLPAIVLYDNRQGNIQLDSVPVKVGLFQLPTTALAAPFALPESALVRLAALASCDRVKEVLWPLEKLRPDLQASVRFFASPSSLKKEAGGEVMRLYVPRKLLVVEGDKFSLWIVEPNRQTAQLAAVTLAPGEKNRQGELVEITQGLQPSDKLIASGRDTLKQGERVRITGEER